MYDYSFTPKERKEKRFFILVIIIVIIISFLFLKKSTNSSKINSPLAINQITQTNKIETKEELITEINQIIASKPGTYSVLISDFNKGEQMGINEQTIFTAASVNKISILAVLYYLAGQDKIDLDDTITLQEKDIQDYGTGSIRYDKPGTVYSLKTLARLMMEKSDNTAYYLLAEQIIGTDKVQQRINSWGLTQTDIKLNKTSNTDQEKLLSMMYQGKVTTSALTSEMMEFMDDSDFEDRLPALLPKELTVYHKIGNEVRNTHDVGIIDLPNRPYYLGVFTSDNPDEVDAITIIATISKNVYDYFSNL